MVFQLLVKLNGELEFVEQSPRDRHEREDLLVRRRASRLAECDAVTFRQFDVAWRRLKGTDGFGGTSGLALAIAGRLGRRIQQ